MGRASVINTHQTFIDNDGLTPLASGTLTFYENKTTTLATIYSDEALSVQQDNPYTLTTGGVMLGDIHFSGFLSMTVSDSTGAFVRRIDNVACFDSLPSFSMWDSTNTYGAGGDNIVTASDSNYYVSLQPNNTNQDPTSEPTWWQLINFLETSSAGAQRIGDIADITPSQDSIITGTAASWEGNLSLGGIRRGFISGLVTSNGTDSNHDIDVAIGKCSDSTNVRLLDLGTAITKQIDATWASGDDAGGLASGATLSNNTWYHVFVVEVGGSTDVMFDSSVTCANGVANNAVDYFRRIGSILTNGSSDIIAYSQAGERFTWDVIANDSSTNNPGTDVVNVTISTPNGIQTTALLYLFAINANSSAERTITLVGGSYGVSTPTTGRKRIIASAPPSGEELFYGTLAKILTDTSSTVSYDCSGSDTDLTVDINTAGWIDRRI